jgi:uncharacterized protein (TIGR02246 family)
MATPMSPEDRLAVIDLIADYAFRLDTRDLDGYVDNFTPDGVFEGATGRREGRDAIRAYVGGLFDGSSERPRQHRHVLGLPQVQGDSESCTAQTYIMIPSLRQEGHIVFPLAGVYLDEIVKHEGRWRFAHRNVVMHLRGPEGV